MPFPRRVSPIAEAGHFCLSGLDKEGFCHKFIDDSIGKLKGTYHPQILQNYLVHDFKGIQVHLCEHFRKKTKLTSPVINEKLSK